MVVPKKHKNVTKQGDKSPSPQPFTEPEGMVTIDLNNDSNDTVTKTSTKLERKRVGKIFKTLLYLLIFIMVIFASFILIDEQTHFLRHKLNPVIVPNMKQQMVKCLITKTFEDCCGIVDNKKYPKFAEICTVNDMLDLILVTFHDEEIIRKKRQSNPENNEVIHDFPNYDFYYEYPNVDTNEPQNYYDDYYDLRPKIRMHEEEPVYQKNGKQQNDEPTIISLNDWLNLEDSRSFMPTNEIVLSNNQPVQKQLETTQDLTNPYWAPLPLEIGNAAPTNLHSDPKVPSNHDPIFGLNSEEKENHVIPLIVESMESKQPKSNLNPTESDESIESMETSKELKIQQHTESSKNLTLQGIENATESRIKPNNSPATLKHFENVFNETTSTTDKMKRTDITTEETPLMENTTKFNPITGKPSENFAKDTKHTESSTTNMQHNGTVKITTQHVKILEDGVETKESSIDEPPENGIITTELNPKLNQLIETPNSTKLAKNITTSKDVDAPPNENQSAINNTKVSLSSRSNLREDMKPKNDFTSQDQPQLMNPCLNQYYYQNAFPNPNMATMKLTSPFEGSQVMKIVPMNPTPKMSQYILNPPVYSYMPFMQAPPQYMNYMQAMTHQNNANNPIQVTGPGGQYYICNPITAPTNNVASIPGVEIRSRSGKLQDVLEDFTFKINSTSTRKSELICPLGQFSCEDGTSCIPKRQICDNEIHCDDGSDEWYCSCRDRVGPLRICDGFFDCPNGEDELGCFGCSQDEFSCDDWSRFRKSTCIPISQRCDSIKQCIITGRDEQDCSVLTDRVGNQPQYKISNTVGYLHRNYQGKWYPTCFGTELWAVEICKAEGGPSFDNPRSHMMLTTDHYDGEYINILPNNEVSLVRACVKDRAAFVECPPLFCGLRMIIKNPYRIEEVDTGAEDINNTLERVGSNFTEFEDDEFLGGTRVVGGKASQPAAWPWLVSIYKNGIFHCGGVLVNELWVVTAAHCVDRYWHYYYEIQAGVLRRFSYSPMEQRRSAAVAIPHENYDKHTLKNDIGLIKLSSPVRFNRYVRPICLPSEATAGRDFLTGPPPGTICTAVGWGATVEHGADPDHMREVEVPILSHCKHKEDSDLDEICAGLIEGGKDACQGDSGGPFMCRNPNNHNQWYLAGIVSHGEGCARPDEPGVYTRISRYSGWIAENMNEFKTVLNVPLQQCPGYVCKGTEKCIPKKHHCDKLVDCLFGDDEMNCHYKFHDIFKNAQNDDDFYLGQPLNLEFDLLNKNEKIDNNMRYDSVLPGYFQCQKLVQLINITKRCNKQFDCEDGTDESNCSCIDYLKNTTPVAICDGITDCFDLSDEKDCGHCNDSSEFYCRLSKNCIDISKRCDQVRDCKKGEDEWDCVILTKDAKVSFDGNLRPKLISNGILTVNNRGVWKPYCVQDESILSSVAGGVCVSLGFDDYLIFKRIKINNNATCNGLYVKCSNVTSDSNIHNLKNVDVELYTSPWNAVIYSEGIYKCMGTILDADWIVTSINCFGRIPQIKTGYVSALLGKGKARLELKGPHEQILRVTNFIQVAHSDVMLLKLETSARFNRYVKYLTLSSRRDGRRKERCYAIGIDNDKTKYIFMSTIENCQNGYKCFESKIEENCKEPQSWVGTIVCDSGNGWYPAAVYSVKDGPCGLSSIKNFTSIKFYKNQMEAMMTGSSLSGSEAPSCDGFRCNLGQCLAKEQICNGIPECRGREDETPELCLKQEEQCHLVDDCVCPRTHLKCGNNKCVSKELFCDGNKDCDDGEDEPDVCTCASYLNLTQPEKICDGRINCLDRSDEDPIVCPCEGYNKFNCNETMCVSNDMVCDGFKDCPNGEDELSCLSFNNNTSTKINAGEVFTRSAGVWHQGCFNANNTKDELQEICHMIGFKGNAEQLRPKNVGIQTALRPEIIPFDSVWIHHNSNEKLNLGLKTGNEPYVKFVEDKECYRLFLACI